MALDLDINSFLDELGARYRRELADNVMPFWMRYSVDARHGGFWTCLERDGRVFDERKYVWMNGRQVWTLSKLYRKFEPRAEWLDAARHGAEFLREHVFDSEGRCWFSLLSDGTPAGYQRKPYGAVFVMLGLLEYAKASGDQTYHALAVDLFHRVQRWIAEPALLGRPSVAGAPRLTGLAEIYVLCSMALELLEVEPDNAEYRAVLAECLHSVRQNYDAKRHLLLENAPLDEASARTPDGRLICVGSIFEIHWLLRRALDYVKDDEAEHILYDTLNGALDFGWDKEYGGFYYFLDVEGYTPLQIEWPMKLWWVHVEALYALVDAYARTRDEKYAKRLQEVDAWVWAHFPDREYGEWFGYLDREGRPALESKGGNYKGCFHIPRALFYCVQTLDALKR